MIKTQHIPSSRPRYLSEDRVSVIIADSRSLENPETELVFDHEKIIHFETHECDNREHLVHLEFFGDKKAETRSILLSDLEKLKPDDYRITFNDDNSIEFLSRSNARYVFDNVQGEIDRRQ